MKETWVPMVDSFMFGSCILQFHIPKNPPWFGGKKKSVYNGTRLSTTTASLYRQISRIPSLQNDCFFEKKWFVWAWSKAFQGMISCSVLGNLLTVPSRHREFFRVYLAMGLLISSKTCWKYRDTLANTPCGFAYAPCMEYLPYIWLKCMVNVGKYSIHGASGVVFVQRNFFCRFSPFLSLSLFALWNNFLRHSQNPSLA